MAKRRDLQKLRRTLVSDSKSLVEGFFVTMASVVGHHVTMTIMATTPTQDPLTQAAASLANVKTSMVAIGTHGLIIQQWHTYLEEIFACAVRYSLCAKTPVPPLGRIMIAPANLQTNNLLNMRDSFVAAVREPFSFLAYPQKLEVLNAFFGTLQKQQAMGTIRKHVLVRNMFQHNGGVVRPRDLRDIGGKLELHCKDGQPRSYSVGETVDLSKPDLDELVDAIETFSRQFEEL